MHVDASFFALGNEDDFLLLFYEKKTKYNSFWFGIHYQQNYLKEMSIYRIAITYCEIEKYNFN